MRAALFPLALLVLLGCRSTPAPAPAPRVEPAPTPTEAPLLSLQRTPCLGRCPVYTVELFADGRLRFLGSANVSARGEHEAQLTPEHVQRVVTLVEASRFATWKGPYDARDVTDMPGAVLTFRGRRIVHYHGDNSAPADLTTLETDLDEMLGTAQWIRRTEAVDR